MKNDGGIRFGPFTFAEDVRIIGPAIELPEPLKSVVEKMIVGDLNHDCHTPSHLLALKDVGDLSEDDYDFDEDTKERGQSSEPLADPIVQKPVEVSTPGNIEDGIDMDEL